MSNFHGTICMLNSHCSCNNYECRVNLLSCINYKSHLFLYKPNTAENRFSKVTKSWFIRFKSIIILSTKFRTNGRMCEYFYRVFVSYPTHVLHTSPVSALLNTEWSEECCTFTMMFFFLCP